MRLWLVDRDYTQDRDIVGLVYASTDGSRHLRKEVGTDRFARSITAAIDVSASKTSRIRNDDLQAEYAEEARRMADEHDPDDPA